MNVNSVVKQYVDSSQQTYKAYFRLLDDWADLYLDGIRIRERMRKKDVAILLGSKWVVYLGEEMETWRWALIREADFFVREYFEGIGKTHGRDYDVWM